MNRGKEREATCVCVYISLGLKFLRKAFGGIITRERFLIDPPD